MSIVVDAHMNIHCTIPSTFLYVGKHKNVKGNFYAIKDTPPPKKGDSVGGKSFSLDGTVYLLLHKTHHLSELYKPILYLLF